MNARRLKLLENVTIGAAAVVSFVLILYILGARAAQPGIAGGKFEVTCSFVGSKQVDPIVAPGVPVSAHLHDFFGNRNVTENSTPASLVGGSTSCKIAQDAAGYWVPAAYRTDTGTVLTPQKVFAYYFGTAGVTEAHIPAGLKLLAGNAKALSAADADPRVISFSCGNGGNTKSPVRPAPYNCLTESKVRNSDGVVAVVKFPYCWNGTGLEPTDVVFGDAQGNCPPAFPVRLPQLQIHEHFGPGFQRGDLLAFSSGPWYTYHGDFMNGWVQAKLDALVDGCMNAPNRDCGFLTPSNPGPS